jgi:glyoxylase-like metal-dependent hydrolase (beta-lactamase superfamily II)
MFTEKIHDLGHRIHLIDGYDLDTPSRTGTYVICDDELTLIETGPSMSVPYIINGLKSLNLNPADVKHIIVTHIHLDHSGGVGLLLKDCPNATVYVHPKGARHLVDPSRLIIGAKAVYGADFDRLFNPILPVPENKVISKADEETLTIGTNCTLRFLSTPGHCDHHFSIYDPVSNGIFTGDTLGVKYDDPLKEFGIQLYLPSTSPNQFKPDAILESLERIKNLNVSGIYFGHFGPSFDVDEVYKQIKFWLPLFVEIGENAIRDGHDHNWVAGELMALVQSDLEKQGVPQNHEVYEILKVDTSVCAMGIIDYLNKK